MLKEKEKEKEEKEKEEKEKEEKMRNNGPGIKTRSSPGRRTTRMWRG
jgi:hypothetical protein